MMTAPVQLVIKRDADLLCVHGSVSDNRRHKHHAMQVVWAHPGERARLDWRGGPLVADTLVVEGGIAHRLELESGLLCLVEAHSPIAARLRRRWLAQSPVAAGPPRQGRCSIDDVRTLLGELAGTPPVTDVQEERLDPRVARVLLWLDAQEKQGEWHAVSLAGALALTGLSESRFLHLFSEHVGTPWRSYLVWRRALVAMEYAAGGKSLTEATHAAGYADSAHLSRQFRELFGYAPSIPLRHSRFVQS